MIRMGVSEWMFLLVPAYLGSPGQPAVKRLCVCVLYLAEVGVKHMWTSSNVPPYVVHSRLSVCVPVLHFIMKLVNYFVVSDRNSCGWRWLKMLTSSDAKFRCMWYMVVWSVLLMFMSQFFSVTNVIAFYIFASATMLLLPLVTSIYSTTAGHHGAGLLRSCMPSAYWISVVCSVVYSYGWSKQLATFHGFH